MQDSHPGSLGTTPFKSSNRFPPNSELMLVNPVMFPTRTAKLLIRPEPTASATPAKTIGIVLVACRKAHQLLAFGLRHIAIRVSVEFEGGGQGAVAVRDRAG